MTVSNLGVVFAPTLSIGSVLFRALLGGFYDQVDTNENREKGLKIVWGGLLQDVDYGTMEWTKDDNDSKNQDISRDKEEYYDDSQQQQQQLHQVRHQHSMPALSPFNDHSTMSSAAGSHGRVGPLDHVEQPATANPFCSSPPDTPGGGLHENAEAEESRLMNDMMIREESSVNGDRTPNSSNSSFIEARQPSYQTSTALPCHFQFTTMSTTSSNSNGSTNHGSCSSDEGPFASPLPSPPPHMSIETGTSATSREAGALSPSKISSEAPQLPPIEGLSIAL
jgi:hypothetical protein